MHRIILTNVYLYRLCCSELSRWKRCPPRLCRLSGVWATSPVVSIAGQCNKTVVTLHFLLGPIEWIDELLSTDVRVILFVQTVVRLTAKEGGVHKAVLKVALVSSFYFFSQAFKPGVFVGCEQRLGREASASSERIGCCWRSIFCLFSVLIHYTIFSRHLTVVLLDNLRNVFCGDEFSLQREALLALQSACLDINALEYVVCGDRSKAVCAQLVRSLKMHSDCETTSACIEILQAAYSRSVAARPVVLDSCVSLGLMDVLDELQYGQGGEEVGRRAAALADLLYSAMDHEEEEALTEVQIKPVVSMGRGQHLAKPAWMNS